MVSNADSCRVAAGINVAALVLGIKPASGTGLQFVISPNPVSDELILIGNTKYEQGKITIYNIVGETIFPACLTTLRTYAATG